MQHVAQWEKWVLLGYELKRAQFYVTGSSSKLLSREFGTALSGRFLAINVFPFCFGEYLLFKQQPAPDKISLITLKLVYKIAFNEYLNGGGFPKTCSLDENLRRQEIIMYYETIILKDIVARYNLKNYDSVKKVAHYLLYLENLVFIELLRKGKEVYFHKGKKKCDFVIKDGSNISQAIQVCRTLQDAETKNRELEGLKEAIDK